MLLVACRLSISLSLSLSLATYGSQSAFLSEVVKSDYIYATNFTSKGVLFSCGEVLNFDHIFFLCLFFNALFSLFFLFSSFFIKMK